MVAPVVVVPTPAPPKPRRWSVGLGIGSLSLAPHGAPDVETEYGIGQLGQPLEELGQTREIAVDVSDGKGSTRHAPILV
jgi:hypothetical protein